MQKEKKKAKKTNSKIPDFFREAYIVAPRYSCGPTGCTPWGRSRKKGGSKAIDAHNSQLYSIHNVVVTMTYTTCALVNVNANRDSDRKHHKTPHGEPG